MDRLRETHRQLERILAGIQTLVIVGSIGGDEGKGKIADLLAEIFNIIARYSGGENAGHTCITQNGAKVVGHQIPCGLAAGKTCILGRGVFFNLRSFLDELMQAKTALNTDFPPVFVDEGCSLWTPWHRMLENYLEFCRGAARINTTGKGIGPLAGLRALKIGVTVGDLLAGEQHFQQKLNQLFAPLKPVFDFMIAQGQLDAEQLPSPQRVAEELLLLLDPRVRDMVMDTSLYLHNALKGKQRILAEGSQATGLDLLWGTYPFATAGMATASGAAYGLGLPPQAFSNTIMVTKVFPTRVGAGPFPSEIWERDEAQNFPKLNPQLFEPGRERTEFLQRMLRKIQLGTAQPYHYAQYLQVLGCELGATTRRGRSVGWPDLPWLAYAARINGPRWLAITRLDMISGLESVPVVTAYRLDDRTLPLGEMPPPHRLGEIEIVTEKWEGWNTDLCNCESYASLPLAAKLFIERFEYALGVPVLLVGTGPARDQAIVLNSTIASQYA